MLMKAMVLTRFGAVDKLVMQDVPIARPNDDQVLIKIVATSLNSIDVKTRIGQGATAVCPVVPPVILGWDLSGVVVSGGKAQHWQAGDEVFGSVNFPGLGQTNAQYALITATHLARKPLSISHEEAAAASMAGLTAWQALAGQGHLIAGKRVLIHGASGGVGHMAVQLAKSLGAYVIGTSSRPNKEFVLALGADEHIDYTSAPFEQQVSNIDLVFDTVGGDTAYRSLSVLKDGAELVTILPLQESVIQASIQRNISAHFVLMASGAADMESVAQLLGGKKISVHISHQLPLADLGKAHRLLETGRVVGKIVLTL